MRSAKAASLLTSLASLPVILLLASCGGSSRSSSSSLSSSASNNNSQPIVVNGGPAGGYANGVFTSVNVCVPHTSTCTTVSGVLVDTGSYGLRVLSSALGSVNSSLPQQNDANGNPVVECAQFVGSVTWGPVKTADVGIAGETASSIPIQVIDGKSVPIAPACKSIGTAEEDLTSLGANGILGIGFFIQDCGVACATTASSNPRFYYSCAGSSCAIIGESTSQQVQNPVAHFSGNTNGVVVTLPAASSSAPSLSGSLVFGIGTQSNNGIGSAQVIRADNFGNLKTTFKGQTYAGFIDSGSNAYFFLDSSATGVPDCPSPLSGFYCPSSPVSLSATNSDGSRSTSVNLTIGNASQLFSGGSGSIFPTLGGPNPGAFDWGLPFFFGRKVFVGLESPAGSGPFWAY